MTVRVSGERIQAVREFNRMYTKILGLLDEGMLRMPYTLTEVRVLYDSARRSSMPVPVLRQTLGLDPGYLSRLLARFGSDGLVTREKSASDARAQVVSLTAAGRDVFGKLDHLSTMHIAELLGGLSEDNQRRLGQAMDLIRVQLGDRPRPDTLVLRPPPVGGFGWIIHPHAAGSAP